MFLVSTLILAACSRSGHEPETPQRSPNELWLQEVRARAPFDMNCEESRVELQMLSMGRNGATIGALGCGEKLTYTCICNFWNFTRCDGATCVLDQANLPNSNRR